MAYNILSSVFLYVYSSDHKSRVWKLTLLHIYSAKHWACCCFNSHIHLNSAMLYHCL